MVRRDLIEKHLRAVLAERADQKARISHAELREITWQVVKRARLEAGTW